MSIVKRLTKSLVGTGFSQGISAALSAAGSLLTHPYAVLVPQILAAVRQKVVESLAALAQPILALIPTTFDAAARPILSALGSSGNALIATASLLLGGLAYEKIRDAVMTVVQPKAVQAVAGVIQTTEREIMEEFEGQIVKVLGKPPANPNAGITPNAATAKSAQGAGVDGENGQLSSQNGQPMGHDGSAQGYEQQQQQQQQQ